MRMVIDIDRKFLILFLFTLIFLSFLHSSNNLKNSLNNDNLSAYEAVPNKVSKIVNDKISDNPILTTQSTIENITTDEIALNYNESLGVKNAELVDVLYYKSRYAIITIAERYNSSVLNITIYNFSYTISASGISGNYELIGYYTIDGLGNPVYIGDIDAY